MADSELEHRVDLPVHNDTGAIAISWRHADVLMKPPLLSRCCRMPVEQRFFLKEQNGHCRSRFFAVMGPSGCGKTTFLNMLAKRLFSYDVGEETDLKLGGHRYSNGQFKAIAGYVLADDILFPHLTVRETLEYGARLRMPRSISLEDKLRRVDEVIGRLGLQRCQNTIIGDSIIRGVSGGERKRVCIALELLNRPRLLLLDTPTSGLDSATAFSVCQLLADLARSGECTVICTLNQPQIKIFNLIDELLLLHKGEVFYQGPTSAAMQAYAQAGFPCPPEINPADHVLDVITPLFREDVEHVKHNLEQIKPLTAAASRQHAEAAPDNKDEQQSLDPMGPRMSWFGQFALLFHRALITQSREWFACLLQLVQIIIISVLIGTVFLDIGTDQSSISKRQSVLFFCCINQGIFAALLAVNSYPQDRNVVLRERAAGTYYVSAYFLAKNAVETLVQMVFPLVFSCIVYWLVGLQADPGKFFLFVLFMELCTLVAYSWAQLVSALAITVNSSLSILPLIFEIWRLFGGFFLPPSELPDYFVWIDIFSYVKYTYTGVSLVELEGLTYTCTSEQLQPPVNGTCPVTTGQQTIDTLGLDYISIGGCVGVLFALMFGLRFLAYLAIRFNKL